MMLKVGDALGVGQLAAESRKTFEFIVIHRRERGKRWLIERKMTAEIRKTVLSNEAMEIENQVRALALLEDKLRIARQYGYTTLELEEMLALSRLKLPAWRQEEPKKTFRYSQLRIPLAGTGINDVAGKYLSRKLITA